MTKMYGTVSKDRIIKTAENVGVINPRFVSYEENTEYVDRPMVISR